MMNIATNPGQDPFGLGDLPAPKPDPGRMEQDWAAVQAGLERGARRRRHARLGGMAVAATIALVVAVAWQGQVGDAGQPGASPETTQLAVETPARDDPPGQVASGPTSTDDLIAMSQGAERQLRQLRAQVGAMPSEVVAYQVELQDLIGQVDDALSLSPESARLWGQRLSLQLDLMKLYSTQLRRDYAHVASL